MSSRQALIASYYVPQAALDSSSRRLLYFIDFLQKAGWRVTVAAKNLVGSERAIANLQQRGVAVYPLYKRTIAELVSAQRFDVALLAFWHIAEPLMNTIRQLSPATRIVVDSMDLHFVRHARRAFASTPSAAEGEGVDANYADEMARELNVYAAADSVLAVSRKEAALITDFIGDSALARVVGDCEEPDQSQVAFDERRGMIFVGNFEHPPNADAVQFLCSAVVPRIPERILERHPIYIVGRDLGAVPLNGSGAVKAVRMVGWVPNLKPYIETARISVIPLLYGAGTKRKVIQTLMAGTPAVSTTVGLEGLDLEDGEHLLVADDPASFASAIERLLTDRRLWEKLARAGREHVLRQHDPSTSLRDLLAAFADVLKKEPKVRLLRGSRSELPDNNRRNPEKDVYDGVVRRIRRIVRQRIPNEAIVAVVSRGDPDLMQLGGRRAWHFPRGHDGSYAGYHPADSTAAIDHLEQLRQEGADFVVFPSTALWWLGHYREFSRHLFSTFTVDYRDDDTCVIFDLRTARTAAPKSEVSAPGVEPLTSLGAGTVTRNGHDPLISVVIPTRDRANLLAASLASLETQTLDSASYEVVVVDDGSSDTTAAVCRSHQSRMDLKYMRVDRLGIAAAKNAGIFAARGGLVLFFDDDDVADRDLLRQHVRAHELNPDELAAVLGYTDWAQSLAINEVMRFVTDVGHYLFAYPSLVDGRRLDFTHFWGGRASCKRSLLSKYGLFRPEFDFGSEDIELAFRLAKRGFYVTYHSAAVQHMNRVVSYSDFCRRCERQGRSLALFSRMHSDPAVQEYCRVGEALERWPALKPELTVNMERTIQLETALAAGGGTDKELRRRLHEMYWWTFDACKVKGVTEGLEELREPAVASSGTLRG